MFDLDGQGGTISINGRPAGTLGAWRYGPGTDADGARCLRIHADVALLPLYQRLGVPQGSRATVVLEPRPGAHRPARITLEGAIQTSQNGKITIIHATQINAEPVPEPGGAVTARDLIRARRGRS